MRKTVNYLFALAIVGLFMGCAASYHQISPERLYFSARDVQEGVAFEYKYDVLREKGNKKYAKKEKNKNVDVVAVKITNNSNQPIQMGKNAFFYSGTQQLNPLTPLATKEELKQIVAGYLPYAIFTFLTLNVYNETSTDTYHIGYFLGPGLTIGNMAVAASGNKNLYQELVTCNVFDKVIQPGQTIYGLIGLKSMGYAPITVKMNKDLTYPVQ